MDLEAPLIKIRNRIKHPNRTNTRTDAQYCRHRMHLCHPLSKLTSTFSEKVFLVLLSTINSDLPKFSGHFFGGWILCPPGIPRASLGDASNVADSAQPKIKLSKSNGFMDADVLESIAITKEIRLDIELICLCLCIKYVYDNIIYIYAYIYIIYLIYIIYISYIHIIIYIICTYYIYPLVNRYSLRTGTSPSN